jgi:hypothetical protein
MPTSHRTDLEILLSLIDDPRGPFFERDLREARSALVRRETLHLLGAAREALAEGLARFAAWLRPKAGTETFGA